jgi:hypothetical protein
MMHVSAGSRALNPSPDRLGERERPDGRSRSTPLPDTAAPPFCGSAPDAARRRRTSSRASAPTRAADTSAIPAEPVVLSARRRPRSQSFQPGSVFPAAADCRILGRMQQSRGGDETARPDQNRARSRSRLLLRPSRRFADVQLIGELASGVGTAAHPGDAGVSAARTQPLMRSFQSGRVTRLAETALHACCHALCGARIVVSGMSTWGDFRPVVDALCRACQ